jgi:DNA-binding response OmpR family regulator
MERAHVLVVDDEEDLRLVVRRLLESTGYRMTGAADAGCALEALHRDPPDLVLLDVGLPRVDGWRVLDRIRAASDVPVIMLTARSGELDRVRGLRSGADDYVAKPFGGQELLARVDVVLRRARRAFPDDPVYDDGRLHVDLARCRVAVAGRPVELTPREFKLLAVLVRHPDEVLSAERLLELVWGDRRAASPDEVRTYVSYVRRKLAPESPIETVRGFGYRYRPG